MFNDPTGMQGETTIVGDNGDGTFTVTGYIDDGKTDVVTTNGEKIGNSLTTHSFLDDNENLVTGAVIDMSSNEGQLFLDELKGHDPGLVQYANNAKGYEPYDFKTNCMDMCLGEEEQLQYKYRGGVLSDGTIASARDIGNIGAGYVAGKNDLNWRIFRYVANTLQTKQKNGGTMLTAAVGYAGSRGGVGPRGTVGMVPVFNREQESKTTQAAQKYGYKLGVEASMQQYGGAYKKSPYHYRY